MSASASRIAAPTSSGWAATRDSISAIRRTSPSRVVDDAATPPRTDAVVKGLSTPLKAGRPVRRPSLMFADTTIAITDAMMTQGIDVEGVNRRRIATVLLGDSDSASRDCHRNVEAPDTGTAAGTAHRW